MFKALVISGLILAGGASHAGSVIEPYIGYSVGPHRDGTSFGARVGYRFLGLSAGLDYSTGRWRDDADPSNSLTPSNLGIYVGYTLPIFFRAYLTYSPIARLTAEHAEYNHVFSGGEQFKYGVGFTGLPFVTVNLEYVATHYREMDTDMYGINVSLPIGF